MILKILSCIWLVFTLISENKSRKTELISIIHMSVAFYVTWALFFGSWEHPGRWELLNLTKDSLSIQASGWILFALSIVFGMKYLVESQDPLTYQYPIFTSWIFRHRQFGYFLALFGSWLIAYTGGFFKVPFYFTLTALMFSDGLHGWSSKEPKSEPGNAK